MTVPFREIRQGGYCKIMFVILECRETIVALAPSILSIRVVLERSD